MEEAPKQEELFEKTEEESKAVRSSPKYFKRLIRQMSIKDEEKQREEKNSERKKAIDEIIKK